jgi:hypothetical protein
MAPPLSCSARSSRAPAASRKKIREAIARHHRHGLFADLHEVFDERGHVRSNYLAARKREELMALSEWTEILCGEGGAAKWIITLATKSDLWWTPDIEQKVMLYYSAGPYFKALRSAQRVNHAVLPYCSIHKLFYGKAPMTGFYSDNLRNEHHNELVAHILNNCAMA